VEVLSFGCDAMLGRLARWLRFAGFDAFYDPVLGDAALAARCLEDGRWLLSRDRLLIAGAGPRAMLLTSADPTGQIRELRGRLRLAVDPARFFTRCSRCNGVLEDVARAAVLHRVPPFVAANAERFSRCSGCGQIYWPGSHHGRIARRLSEFFEPG
jgi:uncharacterized protein